MVPAFKYGDIVVIICTIAFLCFYGLAIITPVLLSRKRGKRFSLMNVAIALGMGFVGSISAFILLYVLLGQA